MPFEVFRQLLDGCPLTTDDGMLLRRMVIEVGAMHLLLNCLGVFTHQSPNYQLISPQTEVLSYSYLKMRTTLINTFAQVSNGGLKNSVNNVDDASLPTSDDKSHIYWAKGTGFGTGSTTQSWNVEQALLRQKSEEEHVTVLLQVSLCIIVFTIGRRKLLPEIRVSKKPRKYFEFSIFLWRPSFKWT